MDTNPPIGAAGILEHGGAKCGFKHGAVLAYSGHEVDTVFND